MQRNRSLNSKEPILQDEFRSLKDETFRKFFDGNVSNSIEITYENKIFDKSKIIGQALDLSMVFESPIVETMHDWKCI